MASSSMITLQQRLSRNQCDTEAWEMLIDELWANRSAHNFMERLVATLNEVVEKFPTAGKYWDMLVGLELGKQPPNLKGAVDLFGRSLPRCYNTSLWKSYIRFIKMSNESKGDNGKKEIMQAFEYVLDRLGQSSRAGAIWLDFINFMGSCPIHSTTFQLLFQPEAGKEASKRALRLREIFQQALQVPCDELEEIWSQYERFENSSAGGRNSATALRFIEEARPRFHAAREAWGPRKRLLGALEEDALPWVPGKSPLSGRFIVQQRAWREMLAYEKSNSQGLERTLLRKRVDLTYQQALQPLGRCPELWYEWARIWDAEPSEARGAHASVVLAHAQAALPDCVMFAFGLADIYEANSQRAEAQKIYEGLADRMEKQEDGGLPPEAGTVAWIQFMLFHARAHSAAGQLESRRVFFRARKWSHVMWQVYAFHATLEWQLQRTVSAVPFERAVEVVKRIYELGMQSPTVSSQPGYIQSYTSWLASATGDVDTCRYIYQTAVENEALQNNPDLLKHFLAFEARYGSAEDVARVEERWAQVRAIQGAIQGADAQAPTAFQLLKDRYSHFGLWACAPEQREYIEDMLNVGTPQGSRVQREGDMPAALALFLDKLPKQLEPDQPVPDIDYIISIVLRIQDEAAPDANSNGKRHRDESYAASHYTDIYHLRQKLKVDGSA